MKLFILLTIISTSIFASNYEFKNIQAATDFDFQELVSQKEINIVVFNNAYCPLPDSRFQCFPYEVKLEYISPKIIGNYPNSQILSVDIQRNYVQNRYHFKKFPAVLFLLDGYEVERIDSYAGPNDLILKTLDTLYKFQSN